MHTHLLSYDQVGGKISTRIDNLDKTSKTATFVHMVPWFLRVYLHTLTFSCNGNREEIDQQRFSLAVDRLKPLLIELQIRLPASSVCEINYNFESTLLR